METEQEKKQKKSRSRHEQILYLRDMLLEGQIRIGEQLYLIKKEKSWADMGYYSFADYIRSPEIGMDPTTIHRLLRIWQILVVGYKVPVKRLANIDRKKLEMVLRKVRRTNYLYWIEAAETLTRAALNQMIQEDDAQVRDYYANKAHEQQTEGG